MNAEKDAASVHELHLGEDDLVHHGSSIRRVSGGMHVGRDGRRDSTEHEGGGSRVGFQQDDHEEMRDMGSMGSMGRSAGMSGSSAADAAQVSVNLHVDKDGQAVVDVIVTEEAGMGAGGSPRADVRGLDLSRKRTMTGASSAISAITDESEGGRGSDYESEEELPESPSTNWVVRGGLGGHSVSAGEEEFQDEPEEVEFHTRRLEDMGGVGELSLNLGQMGLKRGDKKAEEEEEEEEVVEEEVVEEVEVVVEAPTPVVAPVLGEQEQQPKQGPTGQQPEVQAPAPASTSAASGPFARVDMGPEWEGAFKGLLYEDGMDALGRPVVVIDADAIPPRMRSSAVTYVKTHLEPVVNAGDYVVVFTAKQATLPTFWILGAYQSLPRPFRKNVQYIILVKPSGFLRAILAFMRPFVSTKASRKIKLVESLEEIEVATEREVTISSLGSYRV